MSAHKDDFIDALRLNKQQRVAILTRLKHRVKMYNHADARVCDRLPFYQNNMIVEMHHPGGTRTRYRVQAVNLSAHGIGFLHGNFCYTGTPVIIDLSTRSGQTTKLQGKVVRCQLVEGRIHEVGVTFSQPIAVGDFIEQTDTAADNDAKTPTKLPRMRGRVLYLEDSLDNREWMGFMTDQMGVELSAVESVEQAQALLGEQKFDLVVTDLWLEEFPGELAVEMIRTAGYEGPILGTTAQEEGPADALAEQYHCNAVLSMPLTVDTLVEAFSRFLMRDPLAEANADPLISEQWSNLPMRHVIVEFLGRLEETIQKIDALFSQGDHGALRRLVYELKGSAGSYGYHQISQEANQVMALLDTDHDSAQLHDQIQKLIDLCASACLISHRPPA